MAIVNRTRRANERAQREDQEHYSTAPEAPSLTGERPGKEEEEEAVSPIQRLLDSLKPVDLLATLTEKLGDRLESYRDREGGEIIKGKIPKNLWQVAIIYEFLEAARGLGLSLCVHNGMIYAYNGRYWEAHHDERVKRLLAQVALKLGYHSPAAARVSDFQDKLFRQLLSDGMAEAPEPKRGGPILINLQNGTLEVEGDRVKLREHRPEDFLTYVLPYAYEPEAKAPIFGRYLERVLPEPQSRDILQEFIGYVFTSGLKLEKSLVLYGGGQNGKSVFFETATELFGKENIAHKGLGDLCKRGERGDNHRAEVENKLINYASELNPHGADVDIFKAITSQEPITARRLYKDSFTFRPTVKLIFNANKLPKETERTEAYFRRLIIIPFEVTIPDKEKDPELHSKIIENELPGVLNWAIEGLRRIQRNRKFTESPQAAEALEAYKRETNSSAQFVEEYGLTPSYGGFIPTVELYRTYSEFCNESGYKRLSKVNFGKELSALGFETDRKQHDGKVARGFYAVFGDE